MDKEIESTALISFLEGQGSAIVAVVVICVFGYLFYREWSKYSLEKAKLNMNGNKGDADNVCADPKGFEDLKSKVDKVVIDVAKIQQSITDKEKNDGKSFERIDADIKDFKKEVNDNFREIFQLLRSFKTNE